MQHERGRSARGGGFEHAARFVDVVEGLVGGVLNEVRHVICRERMSD